jgi:LysM repeat protein
VPPQQVPAPLPRSAAVARQVVAADMKLPDAVPAAVDGAEFGNEPGRVLVVREGETLWRLARRYQVDLEQLRQLNGLRDNHIVTGWTLRLPSPIQAADLHAADGRRIIR